MVSFTEFIGVLLPSVLGGVAIFFVFLYLRLKYRGLYSPKSALLRDASLNKSVSPPPTLSPTYFSWIREIYLITDDEVLHSCGVDALMFLRTIRMCLKLLMLTSVYAFVILFPVYATGESPDVEDFLDHISFTHVKEESPRMWATFVGVYVTSGIAIVLLQRNFVAMLRLTTEHKSRDVVENYTVCTMNISSEMRSEDRLQQHFEDKFGCKPLRVTIAEDISTLETLLKEHRSVSKKLEEARGKIREDPEKRPTQRKYVLCGASVDSETLYSDQMAALSERILEEFKSHERSLAPVAFVTFRSIEDANLVAAHAKTTDVLDAFDVSLGLSSFMAPESRDILWENLNVSPELRNARTISSNATFLLLLIFWLVPVAFISSLTNLDELGRRIPFLEDIVDASPGLKAFLQGFLPTLGLTIFMALLPHVLRYMHRIRAPVSASHLANLVFRRFFLSLVFMVFWVYTVTGTILNQLEAFLDARNILTTIGTSLPQQANFFIGYVTLAAFLMMSLELIQIGPLLKVLIFGPPSSDRKVELSPMRYDLALPEVLLMLVITLSYSMIAPAMLIFGVCYFGSAFFVWKYQILYVYGREWEAGGVWWPQIFNRCIVAIVMFQIVSLSVISLKQGFYQLGFLLPVVALTLLFAQRTQARFQRYFKTLDPVRAKQLSANSASPSSPSVSKDISPLVKKFDNSAFVAPALRFHDLEGISSFLHRASSGASCDDYRAGTVSKHNRSRASLQVEIRDGTLASTESENAEVDKSSPDLEKSQHLNATPIVVVANDDERKDQQS